MTAKDEVRNGAHAGGSGGGRRLLLRGMERDGLVTRTIYPTIPPRVEYDLTELGRTLLGPVMALVNWANDHQFAIAEAHRRFDEAPEPGMVPAQGVVHRRR